MSRPAKVEGKPRNTTVSTKLHIAGLMALDEMCESLGKSRAEILREGLALRMGQFQRNKEIPSA